MGDISLDMQGDAHLERRLRTTMVRARGIGTKLPRQMAVLLQAEVRKSARRFRRTGGYEREIITRGSDVLTRHPASRRLERGFVGRDSSGRIYHQAPQPHWRPAIEIVRRKMLAQAKKELDLDGNS
jgi:hypothetical protein